MSISKIYYHERKIEFPITVSKIRTWKHHFFFLFSPKGVLADHKRFQETGKLESENSAESDCSSDSSLCISDDDEIFEKYREGRLREMNQKERVRLAEQKILAMEKQQELLQDYQGKVIQLDENNYLENVESSGKGKKACFSKDSNL